jgi:hypothetical protein
MSRIQRLLAPQGRVVAGQRGDVLVLSMRRVADLVAYCMQYEFEDIVVAATGADRVEPTALDAVELERRAYKVLRKTLGSAPLARRLTPRLGTLRLDKTYDLFVPVFNHVYELFALSAIPDWRKRCRYAACVINEAGDSELPGYLLETLAAFDRIYICSNTVAEVAEASGRPCSYLPMAVDTLSFCPLPNPPARSIEVLGIGRRSDVTHAVLLARARERGSFYYYDTIRMTSGVSHAGQQVTFSVMDPAEHRFKLAGLLKRSRYFLASRARANEAVAEQDELSGRFFEGAAAGAVMIGVRPRTGKFLTQFDWPDAVVDAPWDDPDVGALLERLDADPERVRRIRRDGVVNSLLRHDWAYRLRTILDDAGIAPPPALTAREARLRELADLARTAHFEA